MKTVYYRGGSDTVSKVKVTGDLTADGVDQFRVISEDFDSQWAVKSEDLAEKLVDPATVKVMKPKQFKKKWDELGLGEFVIGADEEEEEE